METYKMATLKKLTKELRGKLRERKAGVHVRLVKSIVEKVG